MIPLTARTPSLIEIEPAVVHPAALPDRIYATLKHRILTCSMLPEENEERVAAFLGRVPGFGVRPATAEPELQQHLTLEGYLRLTPASAGTDGFFVAVLERDK